MFLPQLKKLKLGARIVSHAFGFAGYEADQVVKIVSAEDNIEHVLYLWTAPLKENTAK